MHDLSLYCLQLDIVWENPAANRAAALSLLEKAPPPVGSIVALPEMFATGFSMNVEAATQDADATRMFLAAVAAKFEIVVLAGVATRGENEKGRNEVFVFGPDGKQLARYAKLHPFTFSGETEFYEAGEEIILFDWQGWKIAPFLCYDLRFPEVFRDATRRGAQFFIVPANWPAARQTHWTTLLQARAIENQAYVAGINRCGRDPHHHYAGHTLIIDPRGEIIADAGEEQSTVSARLDGAALGEYRRDFPALSDRRF